MSGWLPYQTFQQTLALLGLIGDWPSPPTSPAIAQTLCLTSLKSLHENDGSEYCFGILIDIWFTRQQDKSKRVQPLHAGPCKYPCGSSCVFTPTGHLSPNLSNAFARQAKENRPGTRIAVCLTNQGRCPLSGETEYSERDPCLSERLRC